MSVADVSDRALSEVVSLKGRNAVVTGAAWGLGKATARRLAEAGANVVIADLDAEAATATACELSSYGTKVLATAMDAADGDQIKAAVAFALEQLGGIDIWVNNAGIASNAPLFDISEDEWDKVLQINLRGAFIGAREAARAMVAAGQGGVIVNVASLAGLRGIAPGQVAYVSSKHGVVGLTRELSIELAPKGIRVMGIAPGVCLTEKTMFMKDVDPAMLAQTGIPGITGSPLGRYGAADDVARAILFCASDMSSFMTGSTLRIDGGVTA